MNDTDDIRARLTALADEDYRVMQTKIVPNIPAESVLGVRIPRVRQLAKELRAFPDIVALFLNELPHRYYDENVLHSVLLCEIKNVGVCLDEMERFAPYIDNWAVCDTIRPKCLKKHQPEQLDRIRKWITSDEPYLVRLALGMLMANFLDDGFEPQQLELAAAICESSPCREEYYVRMMNAWYFATALAKQYDAAVAYIEQRRLDKWTHNKTIQKATESFRVTDEHKAYLRSLKIS